MRICGIQTLVRLCSKGDENVSCNDKTKHCCRYNAGNAAELEDRTSVCAWLHAG